MINILVLFDIDGTLVELWDVHEKVYAKMFEEAYGIPGVSLFEKYVPGKSPKDIVRDILIKRKYDNKFIETKIERVPRILEKYYLSMIQSSKINVLPGVVKLLDSLKSYRVPLGILTGNHRNIANIILDKGKLDHYFLFKITADESEDRKERIKLAMTTAEKMTGIKYNPSDVYFFDDSDASVSLSKECGIKHMSVATGTIDYEKLQNAKPDYLFRDLNNTTDVVSIILGE